MNTFLNRNRIKIVFVDWFGVLSVNYYWCIQSQKDKGLKEWCDCVFDDPVVLDDWMRGKHTIEYLADFRVKMDHNSLINLFIKDIDYYKPDYVLLDALKSLFPNSKMILVSDNMPLFSYILEKYDDLNAYFHKSYLSHEIGLLKADNPKSLFDHILDDLEMSSFENCVLIDDNKENCIRFATKGGKTVLIS